MNNFVRAQIPSSQGEKFIDYSSIVQCKLAHDKCTIYLVDGKKIQTQKNLKHFESIFPEQLFQRVNKTTIVNLLHITKYVKGKKAKIILVNEFKIELSIRKAHELLKRIKSLFLTINTGKIYTDLD